MPHISIRVDEDILQRIERVVEQHPYMENRADFLRPAITRALEEHEEGSYTV